MNILVCTSIYVRAVCAFTCVLLFVLNSLLYQVIYRPEFYQVTFPSYFMPLPPPHTHRKILTTISLVNH